MTTNLVNQYSATVKGGFWPQYSATLTGQATGGPLRRRAAQALSRKGARPLREMMATLNGTAAGSAASETQGRIEANEELGGVRTVETETLLDENSAAADVTTIAGDILAFSSTFGSSPPANLDGNPLGFR